MAGDSAGLYEVGAIMFKILVSFLVYSLSLLAQISTDPVNVVKKPGEVMTVTINYSGTGTAGVQWKSVQTGGTLENVAWSEGPATTASSKTLYCYNLNCLVVGMNQNTILTGPLAVMTGRIPLNQRKQIRLDLTSLVAVDADGTAVPLTNANSIYITIIVSEDLNEDGLVDEKDLALLSDQANGKTACTTADLNGDGECNLRDALRLIAAATVPPLQ